MLVSLMVPHLVHLQVLLQQPLALQTLLKAQLRLHKMFQQPPHRLPPLLVVLPISNAMFWFWVVVLAATPPHSELLTWD